MLFVTFGGFGTSGGPNASNAGSPIDQYGRLIHRRSLDSVLAQAFEQLERDRNSNVVRLVPRGRYR